MSAPVKVGREATHGTIAASFASAPVNFSAKLNKANWMPDEQRGGQDTNFSITPGVQHEEWSIADSPIYEDNFGFFLDSALGLPVSTLVGGETTVWDSVFKLLDDPASLSFQFTQPRRSVQGYQTLFNVVDKLTISFDANGALTFNCTGIGMSESEIATPTFSFSTKRPLAVWSGVVTFLGGGFARLIKGSVTITRNRKAFRTINNTLDPVDMSIGNRMVEFALTADFNTKTAYDKFKSATPTDSLSIIWTDTGTNIGVVPSNPQLTLAMGTMGFAAGSIDDSSDFPAVELTGKAIYNITDASSIVATLRSTKQYSVAVS